MSYTNIRKIGNKETIWFLVILFVSKILFADINRYVSQSGTAAYMQTMWCAFLALVIFLVMSYLSGENDIFQAAHTAFGNIGMKIVGVVISLMLLSNAGVMLRVYGEIISSIVLPDASEFFILAVLIVAVSFAAFSGIGTLAAYSFAAGIVLVATLGVILTLNIPNYDISNIYPVFGNGVGSIISGIDGLSVYADVFLVFLMATHFGKGTSARKSGVRAIVISGVVITATAFLYILTVPYPAATEFSLPILEIAFDVNLDVIFQRAEGLFLFLWIFSGFIVIGAYMCFSILSFERTFNLTDRRGVIGVFLLIGLGIAMSMDSVSLQRDLYAAFYGVYTVLSYGLPVVVFGVRKLRSR